MKIVDFTENQNIIDIITNLKKDIADEKIPDVISDVIDGEGHQYVDIVQEGGGVLGIALLGYTYVLEEIGIRFFSIAGTSAGAINSMLLAATGTLEKRKTEKILEILANKNLFDFVDGPFFVKLLLKAIRTKKDDEHLFLKVIKKVLTFFWISIWILPVLIYALFKQGLNPGRKFTIWILTILENYKRFTYEDLQNKRQRPKSKSTISIRDEAKNKDLTSLKPIVKIIAAEITTETRVIFPEMNSLFWDESMDVTPALYVRASMSIPVFFQALKIKNKNRNNEDDWAAKVNFKGKLPKIFYFVDGGILSNFPIDVFHNPKDIPRLPTFGVKLGDDRSNVNNTKSLAKFLAAIFNSARHVLDDQFLLKNKDYENLITRIDTGNHNWLNFTITDKDKIDLFIRGAQAADEFLRKFSWDKYKKLRASLL